MFRFKQFVVEDSGCAMKVGTDGILLGAWAAAERARRILDIGCGTGLISLMMAQRYPTACVDGVDVDASASQQASVNFQSSCWTERLSVHHADIRQFRGGANSELYDSIVSNPPWFRESLKSQSAARNLARHSDGLRTSDLLRAAKSLLSTGGRFSVIIPAEDLAAFLAAASAEGFYCHRRCTVFPRRDLNAKRCLLELRPHPATEPIETSSLVIENSQRHDYTAEFRALTKDFYLRF